MTTINQVREQIAKEIEEIKKDRAIIAKIKKDVQEYKVWVNEYNKIPLWKFWVWMKA
jgi:hypothetical protein